MNEIHLTHDDPEGAQGMLAQFMDDTWTDTVVRPEDGPTNVYKPDGTLLLALRPQVLDLALCEEAKAIFRPAAQPTDNRAMAAGGKRKGLKETLADGRLTKFDRSTKVVRSGTVGYMDADGKFPHCRATAYTREHTSLFLRAEPFVQAVDAVFKANLPERWAAQRQAAQMNEGDWSIFDTSFSTISVNKNFRTACHRDKGDYEAGFGVMCNLITGEMSGGVLVFPRYRVGVLYGTGDVLLADVHEVHGNSLFVGRIGRYERLNLVHYYRKRLQNCGRAQEEFERSREWGSGKVTTS